MSVVALALLAVLMSIAPFFSPLMLTILFSLPMILTLDAKELPVSTRMAAASFETKVRLSKLSMLRVAFSSVRKRMALLSAVTLIFFP